MVKRSTIRAYVGAIAREFKPRKIVLFGSYAYGTPSEDSDVDLLVVMPHKGHCADEAVRVRSRLRAPFPLDLIVRSPARLRQRLGMRDYFMREIVRDGQVLYEA